jgi:hypothetical protein
MNHIAPGLPGVFCFPRQAGGYVALLCLCAGVVPCLAQGKEGPRVLIPQPLGAAPGVPTRLTLRGLRLDTATEVRCQAPKATARLLGKGKAGGVPKPEDLPRLGDTQVELELTLPPDYPGRTVTVSVVTPAGESPPHPLLVERSPVAAEKEPNDGFRTAGPVVLPLELHGAIDRPQDVDVFRFEGKAGQRLVAEVHAARLGSPLDPVLTLYDAAGQTLASCDDAAGSADARLEVVLPRDGVYYLAVTDANDQGGSMYLYRLSVRR